MIELRPLTLHDYGRCVRIEEWVEAETLVEHGVAVWDGDLLVAVAGVLPYWPGVGEAWFALGPGYQPRHAVPGIRRIRNFLALQLAPPRGYRRVQADIAAGTVGLVRWIELLGFKFESEMPLYGPDGNTYYRYVRFA